jgi:hypothetical protein
MALHAALLPGCSSSSSDDAAGAGAGAGAAGGSGGQAGEGGGGAAGGGGSAAGGAGAAAGAGGADAAGAGGEGQGGAGAAGASGGAAGAAGAGAAGSAGGAGSAGAAGSAGCAASGQQGSLACTGLFADFAARTLAPGVRAFTPGYQLWSDGAQKTRWIYLPPGSTIDVSDMNEWVFPVGTKAWKEFRLVVGGVLRPVETRLLEKGADGTWTRATYLWSDDLGGAAAITGGVKSVPGTDEYEVPGVTVCDECHKGRKDALLGFEALMLAAPSATGLTYQALQAEGLLASSNGNHELPAAKLAVAGSAVEQKALGLMHINCGVSCHQPGGTAALKMRLEVGPDGAAATVAETPLFKTGINAPSPFVPAVGPGGPYYQLRPLDLERSMIYYRTSLRDGPGVGFGQQMPAIATHKVDDDEVAALKAWILAMTPEAGYPAPAP